MHIRGRLLAYTIALAVVGSVMIFIAACSPTVMPTSVSTQVLIPSTPTDTPSPVPPTPTQPILPGPEDVVLMAPAVLPEATPVIDRALINQVIADLAEYLEISEAEVEIVRLEAAVWDNIDLGCGDDRLPALDLEIEGYRMVFMVEDTIYEYHTDTRTKIRRCPKPGVYGGTTTALITVDPIAAELVVLAQRRVAQQLDLPSRRVRLVDIMPVVWTESSLGCPLSGQEYQPATINGYRIVVSVGDEEYLLHTDTVRVYLCDPENEQLPEDTDPAEE